jgi:transposase
MDGPTVTRCSSCHAVVGIVTLRCPYCGKVWPSGRVAFVIIATLILGAIVTQLLGLW